MEQIKKAENRLFVDMDGTLTRFHDEVNYLEQMYEPGFFENLQPFDMAVEGLNDYHQMHPEVEIYVLSSCIDGYPPYCETEKNKWLDKYLPFVDKEHRLFPKLGQTKISVVPGGIYETDYLYDDYNKNLAEWKAAGGTSIKCKNNINHKGLIGPLWDGLLIENNIRADTFALQLAACIGGYSQQLTENYYAEITPKQLEKLSKSDLAYEKVDNGKIIVKIAKSDMDKFNDVIGCKNNIIL